MNSIVIDDHILLDNMKRYRSGLVGEHNDIIGNNCSSDTDTKYICKKILKMDSEKGPAYLYDVKDSHYSKWRHELSNYYLFIAARQKSFTFYHLLTKYIKRILDTENFLCYFSPSRYERENGFFLKDYFEYRDPILHLETNYLTGSLILSSPYNNSQQITVGDRISEIYNKEKRIVIDYFVVEKAWEIASRLHDVGRVFEFPIEIPKDLNDDKSFCIFLKDAIDVTRSSEVNSDNNHGYFTAVVLYRDYWEKAQNAEMGIAFSIAIDAIAMHDQYIRRIISEEELLNEEWEKNPLGVMLAFVIILNEISARICLQKKRGNTYMDGWRELRDIRSVIPVSKIEFPCPTEKGYAIEYFYDSNIFSIDENRCNPINPDVLDFTRIMMARLGLVKRGNSESIYGKWNLNEDYQERPAWLEEFDEYVRSFMDWATGNRTIINDEPWFNDFYSNKLDKASSYLGETRSVTRFRTSEINKIKENCITLAKQILESFDEGRRRTVQTYKDLSDWYDAISKTNYLQALL